MVKLATAFRELAGPNPISTLPNSPLRKWNRLIQLGSIAGGWMFIYLVFEMLDAKIPAASKQ